MVARLRTDFLSKKHSKDVLRQVVEPTNSIKEVLGVVGLNRELYQKNTALYGTLFVNSTYQLIA